VNVSEQHLATRRNAGLFDFSFMSLTEVEGPAACAFLGWLQTRSLATLQSGGIVYTLLLNDDASVFIDATLWKHADGKWWLFTGRRSDYTTLRANADRFDVRVRDRSGEFTILALQGPASGPMLAKLGGEAFVRGLHYFRFGGALVGGVHVVVGRLGYSGELGYEFLLPVADAAALGKALLELGAVTCEFDAADSLRIESGYVLFDREITGRENPLDLRLERFVEIDGRKFRGSEALVPLRQKPPERGLTGLEIVDRQASSSLPLARATSECHSPIFRRHIALGFAPCDLTFGSWVRLADGRLARTARLPFYDSPRELPRSQPL